MKKAFCKMCVTICGRFCPDEGAVAGYAEAFIPVQSDSQTSEWYIYFENDVPDTKKACRNICRVELICYI